MKCSRCGGSFVGGSCLACGFDGTVPVLLDNTSSVSKSKPKQAQATPLEDYGLGITKEDFLASLEKVSRRTKKTPVTSPMESGAKPPLPKDARPSDRLGYALQLLKADKIKAFTQVFQQRCSRYGDRPEVACDAYYEVLVEMNQLENIRKELLHWEQYLRALPECQHTRGARQVLLALAELCAVVDSMKPEGSD